MFTVKAGTHACAMGYACDEGRNHNGPDCMKLGNFYL